MVSFPIIAKSTNMAAAAARVMQVVRPHIPSIKFPSRAPKTSQDSVTSSGIPKASELPKGASAPAQPSSNKSVPKGERIESSELPPRFRRKLMTAEEMEYIEKGGKV